MKVSVITCCWNSEPYIAQCIESVRSQSYADIEHVFVDGGSTDGTLERIRALDGNVRVVEDVRGGISNAMNVGVQHAKGEFIIHLHADDYFAAPDVVARAMAAVVEGGTRWVFGRIDDDVDGRRIAHSWQMPPFSYRRLLRRNIVAHPSVFLERSLFLEMGGFDVRLKYAMDYDMWLRLARRWRPAYLDLVVSVFRRHAGSTSTANAYATFVEDYQVRQRHLPRWSLSRLFHKAIFLDRKRKLFPSERSSG